MKRERFNELLAGALRGPVPMMTVNRLATALFHVVEQTGSAGEKALEAWCRERDRRDQDVDDTEDGELVEAEGTDYEEPTIEEVEGDPDPEYRPMDQEDLG